MKTVKYSVQAKNDLKRYSNNPKRLKLILDTIIKLQKGETLPDNFYVHPLRGLFEGCLECHIQGDILLVWIDEIDKDLIKIVRIGTHHQLFGL